MKKRCIIHYKGFSNYSNLKKLSEKNKERILLAKEEREKLGSYHHHKEQCDRVPDKFGDNDYMHLEPCYKKFTLILAGQSSRQGPSKEATRSSSRNSTGGAPAWTYPNKCNICKKGRMQHGTSKVDPIKMSTFALQATVKAAAKDKDQNMYSEIQYLDLIAKEFKMHDHCRKKFTKGYGPQGREKEQVKAVGVLGNTETMEDTADLKTDFLAVKTYIEEVIIGESKVVSMKVLQAVYGDNSDDKRYRHKLKQKILQEFPDSLHFVQPTSKCAEVVFSRTIFDEKMLPAFEPESNIIHVAKQLREDIITFCKSVPTHKWPPTIESLTAEYGDPPESLKLFLKHLLTTEKTNKENACRLINSITSDFIHNISNGRVITPKHYLFALGLHNMTGQRQPVVIANKLGHCLSYDACCEIETSLSEAAIAKSKETNILQIRPEGAELIPTIFWVDNFDVNVERSGGGGAINTTHLVAFQEQCPHGINNVIHTPVQRSRKRRKLSTLEKNERPAIVVDVNNAEPPNTTSTLTHNYDITSFNQSMFNWLYFRKYNFYDQAVPIFSGWMLFERKKNNETLQRTVETFLPPIASKVTDFVTISKFMSYLQSLASSVNMPYVNITLDVGAAINAYKFLWLNEDRLNNVVIHLGDFHFMKENFQVLGMIVQSSGFEDVVFQARLCKSGSLNGVIKGSHYNRAWFVHSLYSEALERLLLTRFLAEKRPNIPEDLDNISSDPQSFNGKISVGWTELIKKFENYRQEVREGKKGKTAQFWVMYLDLMRIQHQIHTAVQTNNFEMRLNAWKEMLPLYFALNKTNYARYGTWYVQTMVEIDERYPGLKELLKSTGLSVQAQTSHPIRTSVDQRGEQSINRDAKTAGGVRFFASNKEAVLKWCLNRPDIAKTTAELKKMTGTSKSFNMYKPMRPSQMLASEKHVTELIRVLEEEYINPFGFGYDELFNLSSGESVEDEMANRILNVWKDGKEMRDEFIQSRLKSKSMKFHEPLKRCVVNIFENLKKSVIKCKHFDATIEINRNILGSLLSFSIKHERAIDISAALAYPLSPIPLSLAHGTGKRRETSKSKLMNLLAADATLNDPRTDSSLIDVKKQGTFAIDLIAAIRTLTNLPDTYEEFSWNFINTLPKGFRRYDIVADTYRLNSIKGAERNERGSSQKVIIASAKSKLPRDFSMFMKNGENKTRLIEIISEVLRKNFEKVLTTLKCSVIYFSQEDLTYCLTENGVSVSEELTSNREEADTKIILHCHHALQEYADAKVVLRSPSGDTDIFVLALSLLNPDKVYLDYGKGKLRKGVWLHQLEIDDQLKVPLIGFHAFTGNDYVSSFFRKGKSICWKTMIKNQNFVEAFRQLGDSWNMSDDLLEVLEHYTCALYGHARERSIDTVRAKLFDKKYMKNGKVIDLALLPPCKSVLLLHMKRANYVAKIWKSSLISWLDLDALPQHGWLPDGSTIWVEDIFPREIEEILCDADFEEGEVDVEEDELSENDEDYDE